MKDAHTNSVDKKKKQKLSLIAMGKYEKEANEAR